MIPKLSGNIINAYPADILLEQNALRSIKILVKEQKSLKGGFDELKKELDKTSKDVQKAYNTLSGNSAPTSAEKQKQIGNRTKKLTKTETVYGLALPLPNELTDSQSHQWVTTDGFVGTNAKKITDAEIVGTSINKALGELASSTGARKPMVDPGYFQDYNGTEPREFSFSWDLIPNNKAEAEQIKTILYHLKKYTLPTTAINGIALLSPYVFDIQIGNDYINSLMNMNNVVCKSMNISYAADGKLQYFTDGTPKFIKLDMSFAERSTVTADFY